MESNTMDSSAYINSLVAALENSKNVRLHLEDIIAFLHSGLEQERNERQMVEAELIRLQEHLQCMREAHQDEIQELEEVYRDKNHIENSSDRGDTEHDYNDKNTHNADSIKSNGVEGKGNRAETNGLDTTTTGRTTCCEDSANDTQCKAVRDLLQQQELKNGKIQALTDKVLRLKAHLKYIKFYNNSAITPFDSNLSLNINTPSKPVINIAADDNTSTMTSSEYSLPSDFDESSLLKIPKNLVSKLWRNLIDVCKDKHMFLNSELAALCNSKDFFMFSLDGSNKFLGLQSPNALKEPFITLSEPAPGIFKLNHDDTVTLASTNAPYVGYKLASDKYLVNVILTKRKGADPILYEDTEDGFFVLKTRSKNLYLGLKKKTINDTFGFKKQYTPANSNSTYPFHSHKFGDILPSYDSCLDVPSLRSLTDNFTLGFVSKDRAARFRLISIDDYLNIQANREANLMMCSNKPSGMDVDLSDWVIVPEITAYNIAVR